jgi:DNA-binding Lrp family transcriptional regulator
MVDETSELSAVDKQILTALTINGRLSMNELADVVSVSRATAYSRVSRLERTGVITGYQASVDHLKVGREVTALVLCSTAQGRWRDLREKLTTIPGVEHAWFVAGPHDVMLVVRVKDARELRDVVLEQLGAMPEILSTQTMLSLDEIARPLPVS